MMDENKPNRTVGRTWVDLWVGSGYIIIALLFLVGVFVGFYYFAGNIPQWLFIAIGASILFVPFLFERAKEDSKLFMVCDEPLKLSEYRIGSKVDLEINGIPARMVSKTGINRFILKSLDNENLIANGSPLGEYSQFEQIRTMSTLQNLTNKLEDVLKEDRLTSMQTGLEVEKQSKAIVDWALRVVYGSLIPDELSDALGLEIEEEYDQNIEDLLEVD